jgi:hypothetical protein
LRRSRRERRPSTPARPSRSWPRTASRQRTSRRALRTLHNHHERGLPSPAAGPTRTTGCAASGTSKRPREILGWRALVFSLAEIGELLDEPG